MGSLTFFYKLFNIYSLFFLKNLVITNVKNENRDTSPNN